jgi:inhibitor of cysteine peptidase
VPGGVLAPRAGYAPAVAAAKLVMAAATCSLTLLLAGGCGLGDQQDDPTRVTELSEPIEVEAGGAFEIVLESNPTTGYEWILARRPPAEVVSFEGSSYEPEPGAEEREGAGGEQALRFSAGEPGRARIELEYVFTGGGDEDRPPASRVAAEVSVR